MITFVSLESYHIVFYNVLLLLVLVVFAQSYSTSLTSSQNLSAKNGIGYFSLLFTIFYLGLRPISFVFADMAVYAQDFEAYALGMELETHRDVFFEMFMKACAQFMSAPAFFFLCTALYTLPLFIFSKKMLGKYWFYGFFMLILSFSFYAYGTNGIRNGIATSLFMLAISRQNKVFVASWMILSIMIHQSMMVPALAYVIALFYHNVRLLLLGWLAAIPMSLAFGGFWQGVFMGVGLVDESRVVGYLSGSEDYLDRVVDVEVGFRWDFLLYSATGVLAGWYFIVRRKFDDTFYNTIFSVYLITNALWILVIRANFSNRIAYLSWFLLGAVIIYPLVKNQIIKNQHRVIGGIIAVYFLFTYVINVILTK